MPSELENVYGIKTDEFNDVLLRPETIDGLVDALKMHGSVMIGFTDEEGSHLQILFVKGTRIIGSARHGLKWNDLYVGLIGQGCFGFSLTESDTHPSYYAEKLGYDRYKESSTVAKLAELINGVRKGLVW